jgi:hypothetical protein
MSHPYHTSAMRFGSDDDSVLSELLNTLDIPAALYRLERIGFKLVSSHQKHHVRRMRGNAVEDLFLELNTDGYLIVQHALDGRMASYTDVITSWDEWVTFIRLLVLNSSLGKRISQTIDEDNSSAQSKQSLCE